MPIFHFKAFISRHDDIIVDPYLVALGFIFFCFVLFLLLPLDSAIQGNTLLLYIQFDIWLLRLGSPAFDWKIHWTSLFHLASHRLISLLEVVLFLALFHY